VRWCSAVGLLVTACGRVAFDPSARDYCESIASLGSAPTIDGVVESGLAVMPMRRVGWIGSGPMPDVPVALAIGWRTDGLYFFVDVTDAGRFPATQASYCGDGIELYVDIDGMYPGAPEFDVGGARQFIARAPASSTAAMQGDTWLKGALTGSWQGDFATFPRAGGYRLEAMITGTSMSVPGWSLERGMAVGVDVGINVSTQDGSLLPLPECSQNTRLGQFFLRVDDTIANPLDAAPFWVPTAFCTAVLE